MTAAWIIARVGLGLCFLFTSYFILSSQDKWTRMIRPWLKQLLIIPKAAMVTVAIFDAIEGVWLMTGWFLWLSALLAVLHLVQVLIATDIASGTYRDIGLLAVAIALVVMS